MDEADRSEYERAATGYLIWPLSLFNLAREPDGASTWSRIHTRQAVVYGLVATVGFVLLMAMPLIVVMSAPAISTGVTVIVYTAGLLADVVAFVVLVVATFAFAARATRGELFSIPLVSAIADRLFRLRR